MMGLAHKHLWNYQKNLVALASVAQLVAASSYKQKGRKFDSWSGHMPSVRVGFVPGQGLYERQATDPCFFLALMFLPLSQISKNVLRGG